MSTWWPNGYGAQPLYNLSVSLSTSDPHWLNKTIGFRKVELIQEPIKNAEGEKSLLFFWNLVWVFLVVAKLRITELHCRNHVEHSLFWLEHSTLWWSVLKVFNILGDRESPIFCVHVFMNTNLSGDNSNAFCILPDLICWHNYSHLLFQV